MSIKYAVLGLLSLQPLSGYDIKKKFSGTAAWYYSDNNNQIYRTLVGLHEEDLVSQRVVYQPDHPARKVYTITEKGATALKAWVLSTPALPQLKHDFLIQLAWADQLDDAQLDELLEKYEEEVLMQFLMCRAQKEGKTLPGVRHTLETYLSSPQARTEREALLWTMIQENWTATFEMELKWVRRLRRKLRQSPLSEDSQLS